MINMEAIPKFDIKSVIKSDIKSVIKSDIKFDIITKLTAWIGHEGVQIFFIHSSKIIYLLMYCVKKLVSPLTNCVTQLQNELPRTT